MSEKENGKGNIRISNEVIASIVLVAAKEAEGVCNITKRPYSSILLGQRVENGKVRIKLNGNAVAIDITLSVKYGYVICDVAKKVQQNIVAALESMTGLTVSAVNVCVTGVCFEPEKK